MPPANSIGAALPRAYPVYRVGFGIVLP